MTGEPRDISYLRTLLLQIGLATLATGGILFWVLRDANAEYRLASVLVVLSIWPAMVNFISAQANIATEELSTNLPASVISTFVFFIAIAATVVFKWGVLGVGASMLSMRAVDFLVRLCPDNEAHTRLGQGPCSTGGSARNE